MNVKEFKKRLYDVRLLTNRCYCGAQLDFNLGISSKSLLQLHRQS